MNKVKITAKDDVILEKISIIIDIMMQITKCSYSDAYSVIITSETFNHLKQKDYSTLNDSPQANLASIGAELRRNNNKLGLLLTDDNIKNAMKEIRDTNLKGLQTRLVISYLMKDKKIEFDKAAEIWFNSQTKKRLQDSEQDYSCVAPTRCYDELQMELNNDHHWMKGSFE